MPGLNQRGPMNDGPMTGRGRGLCTGNVAAGQGFVGGYGMGRGLRNGCRAWGGGGRGMGRDISGRFKPDHFAEQGQYAGSRACRN